MPTPEKAPLSDTPRPDPAGPSVLIEKTPGTVGGAARVRGTRLAVWGLVEWQRLGWSDEAILAAYPHLTREGLAAAWDYAARHPEEIDQAIRANHEA